MKNLCLVLIFGFFGVSPHPPEKNYIKLVNQMERKFEKKIFKKYGLECIATSGYLMTNIGSLGIEFNHRGIISKDKLRKLLVNVVLEYLEEINNNKDIQSYLSVTPFKPENIKVVIFISDLANRNLCFPDITVGASYEGKVYFKYVDPNGLTYIKKDFETFEESFEQVKAFLDK